ncbi:ribonucleoside-triphosphate reductase class III catalytic subunit [Caldicellulosiruptor bescii]|uniref:Anaerobic ribonucleoside-triphosphate reductase n=2 Tax=Caldicellulosiruptor bescii TaxID=31899 RepID=B9MPB3_CALBD|nr:ribonucleoside triphosphate reductase [Caldicellulosiruptor bescii]ACM59674.1 anaerobic ribonucleoside-triphosphate reductase [Caldicellulosiruptor bescii DSM 6725]PBC89699.1 ribonucleoside-triphosphate reductase class III catalytic subunit [Caldicellulosiruptor bescii]PBC90022.1 ribonucleoside-triphosphate reductase class III catalytic subunit [Caldicellulosiruptor bescii]PBD04547.1 ribonucleoside-triphosphate reductase class III catalytic subunit [Caldicellulosiruptor bescii]PBD05819.1 ri
MITKVMKRDGTIVDFDRKKIENAIFKAAKAVGGSDYSIAEKLTDQVIEILEQKFGYSIPHVEDIQDIVEKVLIENGHAKTAKAYILYRKQHQDMREFKNLFLDIENTVDQYIGKMDWRVNENSNMSYSLQGLNNHISTAVISKYWLNKIYPKEVAEAHINGDFHLHDLGVLGVYCCGWDLRDLLLNGFTGVEGKVASKPAKHFRSALGQIVNFFYTLQGEAAGAQAFSNFDTYLAPFIYYDKLTYSDVKQALQEFVFNTNVPTRVGFQSPFTNITLDLVPPSTLKDEPVIIGGQIMDRTYKEFQREMDMFNMAFAEVMMEGDAKGRIFSFPIPTYNITKDFDWDSPVVNKIMEMTAKYGLPYFSNFINSDMKPEDARSMCCRLRLDNRELRKRGGGLFGANPLTGSIGVVTINLPRIGYLSKSEDEYFERLARLMDIAKTSLEIKREVLEDLTKKGLYPYSRFYLRDIYARFGEYWKNHFNTIGIVGMHESLLNFMGVGIDTKEGREFAIKVLDFMRERIIKYQEETGILYNLEATPAEGTSYRLARKDKQMFPDIITSGKDEPFYTNSTQLPVDYTDDIFTALDHQEELQIRYTGGTVLHGFVGEKIDDIEVCKEIVKKIAYNYRIPYYTITPTFSVCPDHGYVAGEHFSCPTCGKECEVYSRVVGYYRPVQCWNKGKQEEFKFRKEYKIAVRR